MRLAPLFQVGIAAFGLLAVGCGDGEAGVVDLRADVNRDGIVETDDPSEDADEDSWDEQHGAIFLPNLDDDERACPTGPGLGDATLASCNDAADDRVNGDANLADLARLQVVAWPDAPDGARGVLLLSSPGAERVRLFCRRGTSFEPYAPGDELDAAALRTGVELALEGRDVLRDPAGWDGFVDVTLSVRAGAGASPRTDTVRLRQAPLVITHSLEAAQQVYVTALPGVPGAVDFHDDLSAAVTAAAVPFGLAELPAYGGDPWIQDHFEIGYVSMPAPEGLHTLALLLRAPSVWDRDSADFPLRPAGRVVFDVFRGVDVGGVQQFDLATPDEAETLDSMGNLEAIPPYENAGESYPHGRMLIGSTEAFAMDRSFVALLEAQRVQPLLELDTSWLHVGHVDEVFSFVAADSPRGWALVMNDPVAARDLLQQAADAGHGDALLFEGLRWADDIRVGPAEVSVADVLADPDVMAASAEAAVEIDSMLDVLRDATGITDEELIRVPYLHTRVFGRSLAYQPASANGIVLSATDFAVADPHGPVIDGQDLFRTQLTDTFAAHGITVHFVEDWNVYHRFNGDVHCASNAQRRLPPAPAWWEGGR